MNIEELAKTSDIQKISVEGQKIYEQIKANYEPNQNGLFLAIEIKSKDVYLGHSSAEAVELARKAHPNTIFYLVKIGYSAAEKLARLSAD